MSENPPSSDPTQQMPQYGQDPQYGQPSQPGAGYQDSPSPQPYQGYSHQQQPYASAPSYSAPPQYSPQYTPAYAQVGRDHPQGTLAFVLGLLSILGITILGPFGWYYGRKVVREIDANPGAYTNRGLAMAGMVLGIIATVLLILIAALIVFAVVLALVGAGSS